MKYYVITTAESEHLESLSTQVYNAAHESKNEYVQGYAQAVSDVLEFALRRGTPKSIEAALYEFFSEQNK